MVDQTVLSSKGRAKDALIGTPASGPQGDTSEDPKWQAYVKAYQDFFPPEERFPAPSLLGTGYYNATTAALTCVNSVNGDFSDNHSELRKCLSSLELDAPNGKITLDENRQAIGPNYVTEVVVGPDGNLVNKVVNVIPKVNQQLNIDPAAFRSIGTPSRDVPECRVYG